MVPFCPAPFCLNGVILPPTFHVPFCPRDYVWRKRTMSTIKSPVAQSKLCENANKRYIIIFNHMQRLCYLICQSNWCQNASKFIYRKGEISFCEILKTWSIASLVSMYDVVLADDRNQVDVKIGPRLACFFPNTRCSILPPCSILPRLPLPKCLTNKHTHTHKKWLNFLISPSHSKT